MTIRHVVPLRRLATLVVAVLVVAGCSAASSDTAAPTASPTTDVATAAPSPTPDTAAPRSEPSPTAEPVDFTTTDCGEPGEVFDLLCEVTELVLTEHVEPPTVTALAEAAAEGLSDAPAGPGEPFRCALPDDAFTALCEALAATGGASEERVEAAVRGMVLGAVDPNSAYQDPEQLARSREDIGGQVEGIGALVTTEDTTADDPRASRCQELSDTCRLVIVSVFEGSPADQAGLQADDAIVAVDGEPVEGETIDTIVDLVRGPAGTTVELGIERDGEVTTYEITRAAVDIPIIESADFGDIDYLRLALFTTDADERFEAALRELVEGGTETLVLDLRGNPGGSLDAAVEIASEFLDRGLVLRTISPDGDRDYEVRDGGLATDDGIELYVVVDRGSASASEVVASALDEADRATIVGQRTFGKDTVQQTFELDAGGGLKLTIAKWVTPDGDGFGEGIAPDVPLEIPPDAEPREVVDAVLQAASTA